MEKKIEQFLKNKLIEKSYTSIEYTDWWSLNFGDFWLNFHNIFSKEEKNIFENLKKIKPSLTDAIDYNDLPKMLIIMKHLRQPITNIILNPDNSLTLYFLNRFFTISSQENIVDWQWCINNTKNNPYKDFDIACFDVENISINK